MAAMSPSGGAHGKDSMHRARIILGRTLLVVALLWSGLWLAGRVALSDRLEGGLAALAGQGVAVEHGGQAISGFPFGYEARLTDVSLVAEGGSLRLPQLTGAVHVTSPDRVVARFPERFEAVLPGPGEDAPGARVAVISRGLTLAAEGLTGQARAAVLRAERLTLSGAAGTARLAGLTARGTGPGLAPGGRAEGRVEARDLTFDLTLPAAGGGRVDIEARIGAPQLTGATDLVEDGALARMIAGHSRRPGRAELGLVGASLALSLTATGTGPETDGTIALTAGRVRAGLAVDGGNLDATARIEAGRIALALPAQEIDGTLATGPVEADYVMPLGPSRGMQPMRIRLDIDRAEPDAALWSGIDPGGALARGPLELLIDIAGTARLTKPFAAARPGELPPVVPGTVAIRAARVGGLGAGAEAEGAVEFAAGQAPTGEITVTLEGAVDFLRRLHAAGLIEAERLQVLALALAGMTRSGPAPGMLEARIALDQGRVTVNGEPLR